jgi:hypothetical protein
VSLPAVFDLVFRNGLEARNTPLLPAPHSSMALNSFANARRPCAKRTARR